MNPMGEPDNWNLDLEHVRQRLREWGTGRWDWCQIDYCCTGKNADLEPWGQQGLQLVVCDEKEVQFLVHGYHTEAGNDVCLNTPEDFTDEQLDVAHEKYMDQAQLCVQGAGSNGEWDGDSWCMTFEEPVCVPWVFKDDGVTPDYEATASAIVDKMNEVIAPWEQEMMLLSKMTNQLAGWTDENGNHIPDGDPTPLAAWNF